ncbi:unnamed protein product [Caretta caretta]
MVSRIESKWRRSMYTPLTLVCEPQAPEVQQEGKGNQSQLRDIEEGFDPLSNIPTEVECRADIAVVAAAATATPQTAPGVNKRELQEKVCVADENRVEVFAQPSSPQTRMAKCLWEQELDASQAELCVT